MYNSLFQKFYCIFSHELHVQSHRSKWRNHVFRSWDIIKANNTAELKDGYLTVSAAKGLDQDEQEKETGRYIRRERYAGACQRSYYVGEDITEEDIKAEFKHGILKLFVPKKEAKPAVEEKKYITIEG